MGAQHQSRMWRGGPFESAATAQATSGLAFVLRHRGMVSAARGLGKFASDVACKCEPGSKLARDLRVFWVRRIGGGPAFGESARVQLKAVKPFLQTSRHVGHGLQRSRARRIHPHRSTPEHLSVPMASLVRPRQSVREHGAALAPSADDAAAAHNGTPTLAPTNSHREERRGGSSASTFASASASGAATMAVSVGSAGATIPLAQFEAPARPRRALQTRQRGTWMAGAHRLLGSTSAAMGTVADSTRRCSLGPRPLAASPASASVLRPSFRPLTKPSSSARDCCSVTPMRPERAVSSRTLWRASSSWGVDFPVLVVVKGTACVHFLHTL